MFNLFGGKTNHFLGIDFGTSAVKVVELSLHGKKVHLDNYGWAGFDFFVKNNSGLQSYEEKIKVYLKKLIEEMKVKSSSAYVSIPGFIGLISLIDFPDMSRNEISQAINFEAHKYVPTSMEDVSVAWDIVDKKENLSSDANESRIQVLMVVVPKKEVIRCENIVKYSGLDIKAIELETFSIARSLVGDDPGNFLIIDIGSRACNIILVEKGIVKVNRNIDSGGNEITSAIAESMNISSERAEMLKKQGKDFINSKESMIIFPALEIISGEALRVLNAYKSKIGSLKIDAVILSGGSAKLKGIDAYFSKVLNIKTIIGDPWKKIEVDEKIIPTVRTLGTSFSAALGLALKGIEEHRNKKI
jgi:type IV pilus assembly protein PilM